MLDDISKELKDRDLSVKEILKPEIPKQGIVPKLKVSVLFQQDPCLVDN